jgi:hypothetical protein
MIGSDWLSEVRGWDVYPDYAEYYELDGYLAATIEYHHSDDGSSFYYWTIYSEGNYGTAHVSGSCTTLDNAVIRIGEEYPAADPYYEIGDD